LVSGQERLAPASRRGAMEKPQAKIGQPMPTPLALAHLNYAELRAKIY
jgi:hypothetical protein